GVAKDCHLLDGWCNLLQQLKPLCANPVFELGKSSDITTGLRQAIDEAGTDWIDDVREHDGYSAGNLLQCPHARGRGCHEDIRRERDQFRRVFTMIVDVSRAWPASVDLHVATVDPTELRQSFQKRGMICPSHRISRT